ncbi:MAG: hypothetical protein WEC84_03520 [Candidatus Andersenbacteria bacterium]
MSPGKHTKARLLHERYIIGTDRKAAVKIERVLVSRFSKVTMNTLQEHWSDFQHDRIYLSTIALKHMFDSRAAQEYDMILEHLEILIEKPDALYENLEDKRGKLLIMKTINIVTFEGEKVEEWLVCSLDTKNEELDMVTAFRFTEERKKKNYLKKYKLLWSWEGDGPPS